jgi:hypothetical protein
LVGWRAGEAVRADNAQLLQTASRQLRSILATAAILFLDALVIGAVAA